MDAKELAETSGRHLSEGKGAGFDFDDLNNPFTQGSRTATEDEVEVDDQLNRQEKAQRREQHEPLRDEEADEQGSGENGAEEGKHGQAGQTQQISTGQGKKGAAKGPDLDRTPYMNMTFWPTERRLDTAIWRALFASSTRQARQFVVHGWVKVNGKQVSISGLH